MLANNNDFRYALYFFVHSSELFGYRMGGYMSGQINKYHKRKWCKSELA